MKAISTENRRSLPFVSVVTPTFNRAEFLPYLLYMYRYQDYPAECRELVILDDSPKSHQDIINTLTQGRPESFNIRYIHHPERLALGKKRNMLNELAQGEYILCMDDDDYYPADKISYTIEMMQKHGATISGSDQIPIWYSHINRLFKTHSFGNQHILNGTFCYHRNYLKKHRYDDDCNLGEELAFTNGFTVSPLQLPGERTIMCVSHSHNTFDKDFVLGNSESLDAALDDVVSDAMLKNWYQSLHNATHSRPIEWGFIDKVVVINLDRRTDRWRQISEELAQLQAPADKIVRLSACEDDDGHAGRRRSHLEALKMAQREGWKNYLLLEDDAVLLKQEKYVNALNGLSNSLSALGWQAVILGGQINRGRPLNSLPGIVHATDCQRVCAYLVNAPYYATLAQQMTLDPSATLEEQWRPLLEQGKWLACSPSLSYQRAGYSDIEKKESDNVRFYFNRVNKNHRTEKLQASQQPIANLLGEKIGFYIGNPFHYQLYRTVLPVLQAAGYACDLLLDDAQPPERLDGIKRLLASLENRELSGSPLSEVKNRQQRYACLVSPFYTPKIKGLAEVNVRAMPTQTNAVWNFAWWNLFYQRQLCYSSYDRRALSINDSAVIVGDPRFDDWHNDRVDLSALSSLRLDERKPTLLYAPSLDARASMLQWAEQLEPLSQAFNLVTLLHNDDDLRARSPLASFKRLYKRAVNDDALLLPLLKKADVVLSDDDARLFDALHAGKRAIVLQAQEQPTIQTADDASRELRAHLPAARDVAELRQRLAEPSDADMEDLRRRYCDAYMDGRAGERAAQEIIGALEENKEEHVLLESIKSKLFN
ncbi:glycosyltransferase [Leminorella grimontii]|uniref:glycosyltransferase n=1 Tax=Leminorella grimontii TaxID=82981 RepID=UPI00208CCF2C|nr:glycosyltransferase [Leminorella grimontii]GKX59565.1 glycosyl transferase [Leminorella grimontii]